ncbi:MAG TPA: acyltransferase [Rhodopila sp.]|nr:acyltransferase [Rhodopila sp.]
MTRQTSVYLDLIRFTAALVVFLGHTSGRRMTGGFLWPIAQFMSEAVTIFFVLSGYVIAYVRDEKERSARTFVVSRVARVYSVALPALVLTFAFDWIGRSISPHVYNPSWGYHAEHQGWQFFANLLFVNRLWFNAVTPGSNLPFWSLGYEVWYYVIFAACTFLTGWRRMIAGAACLLVVGPQIAAMLPIWLIGAGCYRLSRLGRIGPVAGAALCAGCLAGWIGYEAWAFRHGRLIGLAPEMLGRPELVEDYLVAALFAGHLLGFNALSRLVRVPDRVAASVRWVAGATFSLYLFHLPVTQILTALSPWPLASAANRALVEGGTLVIVFALSELTERRKELWRAGLSKAFPG